ncbi:MAG: hypothetical protein QOH09_2425 [Pseudonocardiales bacterium]|jgi:hypothetical protein|nr:hypothetical protein [Pseudonocardiales bacterium]MDT7716433.1 hypothetical protein [Pseudonocardiales bacterium]
MAKNLAARPLREKATMPLDWSEVQRRYGTGATIPTVAGGKTLEITSVDDDKIYIRHRLWTDALSREHLERAAELIEEGRITRHAGLFAEEYRVEVADVRATSAAHVLKHLGFLE